MEAAGSFETVVPISLHITSLKTLIFRIIMNNVLRGNGHELFIYLRICMENLRIASE
jgi:hypothetical protein